MTVSSARPRLLGLVRGRWLCAAVAALGVLLVGCGKEPVTIPTLRLTAADQAVCQRLVDALPDQLGGQSRRKTQPAEALAGAWGDPAIVLQCGVGTPTGLTRTSACTVTDGVGWFVPPDQANDNSADVVLTTVGYRPEIQLTVPSKYRGSTLAAAEVDLAPLVKDYLQQVHHCV